MQAPKEHQHAHLRELITGILLDWQEPQHNTCEIHCNDAALALEISPDAVRELVADGHYQTVDLFDSDHNGGHREHIRITVAVDLTADRQHIRITKLKGPVPNAPPPIVMPSNRTKH